MKITMNFTARIGILAAVFFLALPQSRAQQTLEIYPMGQMDPAALEETVRALLQAEDKIILDSRNGRILVLAEAPTHSIIAGLVRRLNVGARNIRIEVEFDDRGSSRDSALGMDAGGRVIVTPGRPPQSDVRLDFQARNRSDQTTRRTVQTLLVSSGREAVLRVGERIPQVEWFIDYGRRHGLLQGHLVWQEVGSFLVVQPTLIGDGPEIRVRLIPELSGRVDGNPYRVRYASAATEVVVRSGETVSLGGLNRDDTFYSRFLLGYEQSGISRALDIRLTPMLMESPR
ncbi:MAG: hypothetical protein U1E27_00055 [Kiritimatiellia bacterium]|nr:hypothetical protein [Kiritimatiellia bacterium]